MSVSEIVSPRSTSLEEMPTIRPPSRFKLLSVRLQRDKSGSSASSVRPALSRDGSERSLCSTDEKTVDEADYAKKLTTLFGTVPEPKYPPPEITVVGRPVNEKDRTLFDSAKTALGMSRNRELPSPIREALGIQRQIRGTYFLSHMDPQIAKLISKLIKSNAFHSQKSLISALLSLEDWKGLRYHSPDDPDLKGEELMRHLIKLNASTVAVFKPRDEVRGGKHCEDKKAQHSKDGIPPQLEGVNEVFVSGYCNLPRIPQAIEVELEGNFNLDGSREIPSRKQGVLQEFIQEAVTFAQLSSKQSANIPNIPLDVVQEIATIDLRFMATDRNPGNMLLSKKRIYLIDNALIAPRAFLSPGVLLWMTWPQAIKPFTDQSIKLINSRNFESEKEALQDAYPDYPAPNLEVLRITDYLLRQGANEGLSPFQIGWLYTSNGWSNPMQTLYGYAKTHSEGDPEKTFTYMKQYIDRAVYLLRTEFPEIVRQVEEQNVPDIQFGQALLKAMNDAANRFMPKFNPEEDLETAL